MWDPIVMDVNFQTHLASAECSSFNDMCGSELYTPQPSPNLYLRLSRILLWQNDLWMETQNPFHELRCELSRNEV